MGTTKDVRAAVEAELGFDPLVDSADIKVMNIKGDVTLAGRVPSYPQYLEAAAARRVAGVSGVHNNLKVVLPDSDYRDDIQLITAANNALAQNITVPTGVEAIAEDGNVILTGTVFLPHRARRRRNGRGRPDRCPQRQERHRHQLRHQSGRRRPARPAGAGPLRAGPRRQRRDGGHQGRRHSH